MKVNSSGPKSPYNMTRTSSVGSYHGSGLPAKIGRRNFSASIESRTAAQKQQGAAPRTYN